MKTTSAKTLAALAGITTRRLRQLADQGHIPKPVKGAYPTSETLKRLIDYYRNQAAGDLKTRRMAAQAHRDEEQAKLIQLQRRKTEGELVTMEEARTVIRQYLGPMRDILTTAPMALAARVNPADPELARMQLEQWSEDNMKRLREV